MPNQALEVTGSSLGHRISSKKPSLSCSLLCPVLCHGPSCSSHHPSPMAGAAYWSEVFLFSGFGSHLPPLPEGSKGPQPIALKGLSSTCPKQGCQTFKPYGGFGPCYHFVRPAGYWMSRDRATGWPAAQFGAPMNIAAGGRTSRLC